MQDKMETDRYLVKSTQRKHLSANLTIFLFCILGLINNLGYVIVNTSAQNIAKKFDEQDFMAAFQLSLSVFGGATRIINAKYLINIKHNKRIYTMLFFQMISYVSLSIGNMTDQYWGFYLALLGACIQGICSSLGESVIIGFMKEFDPKYVTGWSSGTGLAGVFGTGLYLFLQWIELDDQLTFLIFIFIGTIPYFLIFRYIYSKRPNRLNSFISSQNRKSVTQYNEEINDENDEENTIVNSDEDSESDQEYDEKNLDMNWKNTVYIFPKILYYCMNLSAVYFLEYACTTSFAEVSTRNGNPDVFIEKNGFILIQFSYQFGVLISRSSLYLIRINRIQFLTLFQLINFVVWFLIAYYKFMSLPFQFLLMLWTGLMGGAAYVNINYLILNEKAIFKKEKELGVNICCFLNDTGVLLASIFGIIISITVFKIN